MKETEMNSTDVHLHLNRGWVNAIKCSTLSPFDGLVIFGLLCARTTRLNKLMQIQCFIVLKSNQEIDRDFNARNQLGVNSKYQELLFFVSASPYLNTRQSENCRPKSMALTLRSTFIPLPMCEFLCPCALGLFRVSWHRFRFFVERALIGFGKTFLLQMFVKMT